MISQLLPRDSQSRGLLVAFVLLWAISCLRLPYPEYFAMQHVPTVVAVLALVWCERRIGITRTSFSLVIAMLTLHVVGARYLYSYVPYDDVTEALFGIRLNDAFGFERNHYDRLVHFAFGLLLTLPIVELCEQSLRMRPRVAVLAAVCVVLAASAVYEVMEWGVAMIFAPNWADAYNGQQGDSWDARKDMALAWAGAMVAAMLVGMGRKRS